MAIVAQIVKKTEIGLENGIASASSTPKDIEIFKTVVAEARMLHESGEIEIVVEEPDRVRFRRLR